MGSTGIPSYSTTPIENETVDSTVTWKEGQLPSTVNNSKRQNLTDIRNAFNDLEWFDYGTGTQDTDTHLGADSVYASATSFTITGADVTAVYHEGRRVRAQGSTTGTIYGSITSSSYNAGTDTTTVNVGWDTASQLQNETITTWINQFGGFGQTFDQVIRFGLDGGDPLATGVVDDYVVNFPYRILRAIVTADQSGDVEWDVRVNDFAIGDTPDAGDSIVASAPPSLSSAKESIDATLTGWDTFVPADSHILFALTSVDGTITRTTLTLKCRKGG